MPNYLDYHEQFKNLVISWGLTENEVPVVKYLTSFHEIGRLIRQRQDTKQYIYIEQEDAWGTANDYFQWRYLSEGQALKIIKEDKEFMDKIHEKVKKHFTC